MGIGAYRHLVTLEHPAVVTDPPTWYCSLQSAAAQVGDGLAAFFIRGRYHPGITLETQINWEGRTFQVQGIADLDERHREIQITAVEVVGRGTTPSGVPVNVPPSIDVGPASVTIDAGESVTLTVEASGALPLFYQWLEDGAELPGMDDQFYVTGPLDETTTYAVRVSNAYGSVVSAPATVTVTPAEVTYQDQVIADGASAYWPLDDPSGTTARDLMGTYDGTISGGVTLGVAGVAGTTAMRFDGTTGVITVGPMPAISPEHSFECWSFYADPPGGIQVIFGRSGFGVGSFVFRNQPATAGTHRVACVYTGVVNVISDPYYAPSNGWRHEVLTYDGVTVSIYVDGVFRSSTAMAMTDVSASAGVTIGFVPDNPSAGHTFQDLAIYPRALTPAEILAHYQLRVPA